MENKIIVWGGSHHNTLGVVRSLGEKAIKPCVVICNKTLNDSFILKSKYVQSGVILQTEQECLEYIISHYTNKTHKAVIICTSDSSSSCVDLNYNKLKQDFYIPNGGRNGILTSLMNKEEMATVAKEIGFRIPITWKIEDEKDFNQIEYPCITKPLKSIEGTKDDIQICTNKDELKAVFSNVEDFRNIQVQKYIDKDFEFQLIGCSINGGENIIIPGYSKIIRASHSTNTGFLEYLPLETLEYNHMKCVQFIKRCNYSGLFSLEFLKDKNGVNFFMEINFRNDGNAYSVTGAGVNLPYIWVTNCIGLDAKEPTLVKEPIVVMPELADFSLFIKQKITFLRWIKDVKRTDCFLLYNKRDKKPFYFEMREFISYAVKKVIQRIFK